MMLHVIVEISIFGDIKDLSLKNGNEMSDPLFTKSCFAAHTKKVRTSVTRLVNLLDFWATF